MIYVFDDKKNRQEGYRWTTEKFNHYKSAVITVHYYSEVQKKDDRKKIFTEGNTILFHESFFDTDFNRHNKEAIVIRRELEEFAQEHPTFSLAFFSGSKSSRFLNKNIAYLPVSVLYQNLEEFIQQSINGKTDLNYLLYGKNPNIEKDLVEKMKTANASVLNLGLPFNIINNTNILIATTINSDRLPQIVTGANYQMHLSGDSDFELHRVITANLQENQYDKIFIPLCFGNSLSDFNGLRLAAHIRCTDTINRCTPVYIYSFLKMSELINHDCFNILKLKDVQLVDYSVKAFEDVIKTELESLRLTELPEEAAKLKLEVPKDYEDSHSIANEWAIYRWAKIINADDNAIQKITKKIETQLYFKYLNTIYPTTEISAISEGELRLIKQLQPKILYVDDDAEKGWYEILCKLLSDINKIEKFDYLGDELKMISKEEIIHKAISKVREDDIDLVILDFRLHPDDFVTENIEDVTGLKLLEALKKLNSGIQVIIFTASNKASSLFKLQTYGADGFIFKGRPENSVNPGVTKQNIKLMLSTLEERAESCFLKTFYERLEKLEMELLPRINFKKSLKPLPKEFVDESLKWFKLSIDYLRGRLDDSKRAASFLFMFSVLENLSTRVIDVDNPINEGIYKNGRKIFKYQFRSTHKRLRNYIENENGTGFYRRTNSVLECGRSIPWNIKILNTLDFITNEQIDEQVLSSIVKKRNDFVHSNTTTGNRFTILNKDIFWLNEKIYIGLMNVI